MSSERKHLGRERLSRLGAMRSGNNLAETRSPRNWDDDNCEKNGCRVLRVKKCRFFSQWIEGRLESPTRQIASRGDVLEWIANLNCTLHAFSALALESSLILITSRDVLGRSRITEKSLSHLVRSTHLTRIRQSSDLHGSGACYPGLVVFSGYGCCSRSRVAEA